MIPYARRAAAVVAALTLAGCGGTSGGTAAAPRTALPSAPASSAPSPGASSPIPRPSAGPPRAEVVGWHLPQPLSREVVLASGGHLLVLGGLTGAGSTAQVVDVDPASGTVHVVGRLASAVHDAAGALIGGEPDVFGGGASATVDTVQSFRAGQAGRVVGHLPQPRSDLVAATVGGATYVLAGYTGSTSLAAALRTTDGTTFTQVATLPVPVRYPAVAASGGRIYLFGGEHAGSVTDAVQEVDPAAGSARVVGRLPVPLAHAAAAVRSDGTVVLAGGRSGGSVRDQVLVYDPATGRTTQAGRLPYPVADAGVAVVSGTLWLVGGETPGRVATAIRVAL